MVKQDPDKSIGSHKGILPVILPVALLLFSTGAVRTYTFLTTSVAGAHSGAEKSPIANKGINPTEGTFSKYAVVLEKLSRTDEQTLSRDEELVTLAEIDALGQEPISMDGDTFRAITLSPFSPKTLLLSVSQCLAKKAQTAAKRGDYAVARKYVDALYGIGDHILSSASPSVQGLESAHHFLGFAAKVQVSVLAKEEHAGATAKYRTRALTTLWREQISPSLAGVAGSRKTRSTEAFAARMAREYREGWSRIRAGEA